MAKPVLVTSAAGGRQGKTGRHVAEILLQRKIPVRAFVHKIDERSERLRALGAEIFEGDFLDVRSVVKATKGVSSVYFAYPVQDGLADATANVAVSLHDGRQRDLVDPSRPILRPRHVQTSISNDEMVEAGSVGGF